MWYLCARAVVRVLVPSALSGLAAVSDNSRDRFVCKNSDGTSNDTLPGRAEVRSKSV
jgi:hypothetical protein